MNDIYLFSEPLREARLRRRKNRFIMTVELDGQEQDVHCPSTGRIGNLALEDLPCLLSSSHNPQRKTAHTVEALSLDGFDVAEKRWFGINQTAVNRYMEYFLQRQALPRMLPAGGPVAREVRLGASRLDFLVGDSYVEVKMPLQQLNLPIPATVKTRPTASLGLTDRLTKHMDELGASLAAHERALMVLCFLYDCPRFSPPAATENAAVARVMDTVARNRGLGLEFWQVNCKIDRLGVYLLDYFKLEL